MSTSMNDSLAAGMAYLRGGLSVLPIKVDGSKAPACKTWEPYQERLATEAEAQIWWGNGQRLGVGVIGGKVSGNVEHFDFDENAETIFPAWCELVEVEAPGLVDRLSIRRTPKPGFHASYRCPEVTIPSNTKLAMSAESESLIETRGEGGYVLAPGCPAECHETGRTYDHLRGPKLSQLPTITAAERAILWRAAQSFDQSPAPEPKKAPKARGPGLSPGDDFSARADWPGILEPHGWAVARSSGPVTYWRRPGKDGPGWSATTGRCSNQAGHDLLAVFSSNAAPFEGARNGKPCSCYTKFAAYTLIHHRGDFSSAAKALAEQGYGGERSKHRGPSSAGGAAGQQPEKPAPRLIRLSEVEIKPVEWLWEQRIPRGAVTLIDGDPDKGKSFITLDLTARLTRGLAMPEDFDFRSREPGNVLLLNAEDDTARTIAPRLVAAGADLGRVEQLDCIEVGDEAFPPVLPQNLPIIRSIVIERKVVLVIIDPFAAFLDGEIDSHKDSDIRRVMYQLRQIAEETTAAFLIVRHLNKLINVSDAMYRGGGSIGIIGACRSAMLVGKHPENEDQRVLVSVKSNLCAKPLPLAYRIGGEQGIKVFGIPKVEWLGVAEIEADEVLARPKKEKDDRKQERQVRTAGTKVLMALDQLDPDRKGASKRQVRDLARISARDLTCAVVDLVSHGVLREVTVEIKCGTGHKTTREVEGIVRATNGTGND